MEGGGLKPRVSEIRVKQEVGAINEEEVDDVTSQCTMVGFLR